MLTVTANAKKYFFCVSYGKKSKATKQQKVCTFKQYFFILIINQWSKKTANCWHIMVLRPMPKRSPFWPNSMGHLARSWQLQRWVLVVVALPGQWCRPPSNKANTLFEGGWGLFLDCWHRIGAAMIGW